MDCRFNLKVKFSIFGETFDHECSLNWTTNEYPIDDRIVEFFEQAYNEAFAKSCQKDLRLSELAELKRLREKYPNL